MIALTCSHCDKNLKVKDELAGKRVRCPQCKQALEVPLPYSEDATVPLSGARQPEEEGTIPPSWSPPLDAEPAHEPEQTRDNGSDEETEKDLDAAAHYKVAGEIARGGMGAIKRAVDKDICREVAVKFLLNNADDRQKARFVEEAQITGQLEHPNIVPIHHLGIDEDGSSFFSMKMVKGRSLADILKDQSGEYTLSRLLNIMISICNALAYAHSRQVIHRDLKPANIMVGDFGEVYVMDWGLAKVVGKEEIAPAAPSTQIKSKRGRGDTMPGNEPDSKSQDKVTTRGRGAGDLTQAGSIMGTPTYMPPEQAQGNLEDVDERSDIYSLGAILYEMMTVTPPVGRGGDTVAILMRVVEGKIDPPVERAPERARAGWVPPELAAIALKALARKPKQRYQTVEKLKRDIELFLEGRSVSAKQDTAWEMFKKLVKRNKGASIATASAMVVMAVVVGVFLKVNYDARVAAENARTEAVQASDKLIEEQSARRQQGKESAPSFLADAERSAMQRKFDYALAQVNVALDYDPDLVRALLLKGQLLIAQKKFAEAPKFLAAYLERQPGDTDAQKLIELCGRPDPLGIAVLADFSATLQRQKALVLSEVMLEHAGNTKAALARVATLYAERLESAWPGSGKRLSFEPNTGAMELNLSGYPKTIEDLTPLQGMKLQALDFTSCKGVLDISPLRDMPLKRLSLDFCPRVKDLTPLKGMPLVSLSLMQCAVGSLEPLRGMSLTSINLHGCRAIHDLSPIQGMPIESIRLSFCNSIKGIEALKGMKLTRLDLSECTKIKSIAALQGMQLKLLNLLYCGEIEDVSPLRGMPLQDLSLLGTKVRDLGPLKGLPLTSLSLNGTPVSDLSPLKGMQLTSLDLHGCYNVSDLSALEGMPLTYLMLLSTNISTMAPLHDMKLKSLNLAQCSKLTDLSVLAGMPLERLALNECFGVSDITPLRGLSLKFLSLHNCRAITDLAPLQGMPLESLALSGCSRLNDLSPLKGMALTTIALPPTVGQGLEIVRAMKSLTTIDSKPSAQFWKEYDAKKAGK
jgi:serine/threonine protein kinase/phage FluMu protein Com